MDKWVDLFLDWTKVGLIASFGGAASYVYLTVTKNQKFSIWLFLANLFIAFFVGKLFGEFIPETNGYRSGLLMALGFSAYPVLGVVQTKVLSYVNKAPVPGGEG